MKQQENRATSSQLGALLTRHTRPIATLVVETLNQNSNASFVRQVCRKKLLELSSAALKHEPWALKGNVSTWASQGLASDKLQSNPSRGAALDSIGQPGPGSISGSFMASIGDFEQCSSNSAQTHYCQAYIDLSAVAKLELAQLSDHPARSFDRVPPSCIRLGLCGPSECNSSDFQALIGQMLQTSSMSSLFELRHVECHRQPDLSNRMVTVGFWFSLFVVLTSLIMNMLEILPSRLVSGIHLSGFRRCFSLRRNLSSLFIRKSRSQAGIGRLACLDGIKAISGIATVAFHSYNFGSDWLLFDNPEANEQRYSTFWTQWLANGSLLMTNHVLIAGFLATSKTVRRPVAVEKLVTQFFRSCLLRYLRLTPVLMLVILLSVNILPIMSSGPNWSQATQMFSTWCEQGGWLANLWQFQNRASPSKMCMPQSWHSAVDLQLFVCVQLLLALVTATAAATSTNRNKLLCWVMAIVGAACQVALALTVYQLNITMVPCVPVDSLKSLVDFSASVWVMPFHWFASYAIGCILALQVQRVVDSYDRTQRGPINHATNLDCIKSILQLLALTILASLLFASSLVYFRANAMPSLDSVLHALLVKPIWSCCVGVIIYFSVVSSGQYQLHKTSQLDCLIDALLCSKIWFPLSKLNYLASLLNPLVIAAFYGSRTETFKYNHSLMLYFALGNILLTYVISLLFHLLLELPLEIAISKTISRIEPLKRANNHKPDS